METVLGTRISAVSFIRFLFINCQNPSLSAYKESNHKGFVPRHKYLFILICKTTQTRQVIVVPYSSHNIQYQIFIPTTQNTP